MPKYDDVNDSFEYLDLSHQVMPSTDLIDILSDLAGDAMIRQIDLSYTVKYEDAEDPVSFEEIMDSLCNALETNKHLTALDFAGNHLGEFGPYPTSPHTLDYVKYLTDTLAKTPLKRLDLSDNRIMSPSGRVYSALADLCHKYVIPHCLHFRCQKNEIHSEGFGVIGCLLGPSSTLIELDLNHNRIGLDPFGNSNVDVIEGVCRVLGQSHALRILMLGHNFLTNDALVHIADALQKLPGLNVLDLSGNRFTETGMHCLKEGIQGHANLRGRYGLKKLLLDGNPLGSAGLAVFAQGLLYNDTITHLDLSGCEFRSDAAKELQEMLKENSTILILETKRNRVTRDVSALVHAEIGANNCLLKLTSNVQSVDANKLSVVTRKALEKKLRMLPMGVLGLLHSNPTFNNPMTDIQDELFLLCPPGRHDLISMVSKHSETIGDRLAQSGLVGKKVWANRVIFFAVIKWYRKLQFQWRLAESLGITRSTNKLAARKKKGSPTKPSPLTGPGKRK